MKTLPSVIENLLTCCYNAQGAYEILKGEGLDKALAGYDHCVVRLNETIKAAEQYKKQLEKENLISLFVVSDESERIEIKIPRTYIQASAAPHSKNAHDFLRKEIKELFADACSTLFESAIENVYFEDET